MASALLASAAPTARARAQAVVEAEPTVWLTYAGEHPLSAGSATALVLDAHVRRADAFADWRQLLLRAGITRGLGAHVRVGGGWAYLRTFPSEVSKPFAVWDHRAWQMVQLSHGLGRVSLVHRGRLEERFFHADAASGVADWAFAWRARYQLRASVPLGGRGSRTYVVGTQEVFLPFGPHEGTPAIDQSRTGIALGARLTPTLRLEVGYLNRAAVDDGRVRTRDHALQVALASSAPLHGARRATP